MESRSTVASWLTDHVVVCAEETANDVLIVTILMDSQTSECKKKWLPKLENEGCLGGEALGMESEIVEKTQ